MNPYLVLGGIPLAGEGGPTATTDYQTIIGQVTAVMSNSNITSVLEYAIGAAVVMVFTWWAARKVAGIIKRAFMRGKLKF